jgi:uncharacterized surface protein with fasciclin (FAS1) repeats
MTQILRNLIIIMLIAVFIAGGYFLYQLSQNAQVTTVPNANQTPNQNNGNTQNNGDTGEQSSSEIKDTSEISTTQTVIDLLNEQDDLSIITELIESTDLSDELSGTDKFTLLVPSDTVLTQLFTDEELADFLLEENNEALIIFLKNHIIKEEYTAARLFMNINRSLKSEADTDLVITIQSGALFINDVAVQQIDIRGNNGVVHIISDVLGEVIMDSESEDEEEDEP